MSDDSTRPVCPYCGRTAQLAMDSTPIYGRNYGPVWHCDKCDARMGCHKGDPRRPLGTMANAELRALRQACHRAFDPLWKQAPVTNQKQRQAARRSAYELLAARLGIEVKACHFGSMDAATCRRVIALFDFGA